MGGWRGSGPRARWRLLKAAGGCFWEAGKLTTYMPSGTTQIIILEWSLEKIRYRIIIPEFYVIQICKHGRSVAIGQTVKFSANQNSGTWVHQSNSPLSAYKFRQVVWS